MNEWMYVCATSILAMAMSTFKHTIILVSEAHDTNVSPTVFMNIFQICARSVQ